MFSVPDVLFIVEYLALKPPISPLERYRRDLLRHDFVSDPGQARAVDRLQTVYENVQQFNSSKDRLITILKSRLGIKAAHAPRGLYLWGGVGRGKTHLMDIFFESLPQQDKLRTHFHRFMKGVHRDLAGLKSVANPLERVAKSLSDRYSVICFDEFFVVDIADAMILARLFESLFRRGLTLVATSNIAPDRLYENGLQRARFLPAITLLKAHCDVLNLDSGVDYRLRSLRQLEVYHSPLDERAERLMENTFERLAVSTGCVRRNGSLELEGRVISVLAEADDLIWFHFSALCDGPRSQSDYIELASEYSTVLVSCVPLFSAVNNDQCRRFIYLVDEFYDRGVKLIVSAAATLQELYVDGPLAFEFERTVSRLREMQTVDYLGSAHNF